MPVFVEHVAKSVRADHAAGMDAHPLANLRARIDHDIRGEANVLAEDGVVPHMIPAEQGSVPADRDPFADDAVRPDMGGWIDGGARRDDGARMNAGRQRFLGEEEREHARKGDAWIFDADQGFAGRLGGHSDQNGGGASLLGPRKVLAVLGERQVS
jgi:hypothetical protein